MGDTKVGLPKGYLAGVTIRGTSGADRSTIVETLCTAREEKGRIYDKCESSGDDMATRDVRTQSQAGPTGQGFGVEDLRKALYVQPDGDVIIVDLWTLDEDSASTPSRRAAARKWLDERLLRAASAAADPRTGPIRPGW